MPKIILYLVLSVTVYSCSGQCLKESEPFCVYNADLDSAIKSMVYHRLMMKNYMLSDYLVEDIVADHPTENVFEKRIGLLKNTTNERINKLLIDEGSSKYAQWLDRFSDLEKKTNALKHNRLLSQTSRQFRNINSEPTIGTTELENGLEYAEEGDITGYALPAEDNSARYLSNHNQNLMADGKQENWLYMPVKKNAVGYDHGRDDSYQHPTVPQHPPHSAVAEQGNVTKEIGLKDITDIALTTLAFLSFGMFILQVLMCITMSKDDSSSMTVIPMENTGTGEITGEGTTEEIRRKRRSILSPEGSTQIKLANQLAEMALISIDSLTINTPKNQSFHYYSLCENNKFVKLNSGLKAGIPVWSLGISWLTTRSDLLNLKPIFEHYNPVKSLKAILMGLSGNDCNSI